MADSIRNLAAANANVNANSATHAPTEAAPSQSRRQALGSLVGLAAVPMLSVVHEATSVTSTSSPTETGVLAVLYKQYLDLYKQSCDVLDRANKSFTNETGLHHSACPAYFRLFGIKRPHALVEFTSLSRLASELDSQAKDAKLKLASTIADLCGVDPDKDGNRQRNPQTPKGSTIMVKEGDVIYQLVGSDGHWSLHGLSATMVVFNVNEITLT